MNEYGFFRVAAASPDLVVADCDTNAKNIIESAKEASANGVQVVVFPELCITGYSCGDLFLQTALQRAVLDALAEIANATETLRSVLIVGLPFAYDNTLYNCAAVLYAGEVLALVPKSNIPNYHEFYEARHFSPARGNSVFENVRHVDVFGNGATVPFGTDILIHDSYNNSFCMAIEICEDLWVPEPPSVRHTLAGATLIANLSASNEVVGKADYRRLLVKSQSAKTVCAYVYADSSCDESTQDMVFAGHNLICENGAILAESKLFSGDTIYADVDLEKLAHDRMEITTMRVQHTDEIANYYIVEIDLSALDGMEASASAIASSSSDVSASAGKAASSNAGASAGTGESASAGASAIGGASAGAEVSANANSAPTPRLLRKIEPHPFVPRAFDARSTRCAEIIAMQAEGLAKRLRHIHAQNAVLGISGGLDSTLALLVTCRAFDLCSLPRKGIYAITMPCFGTTDRTYNNACTLTKELGATLKEVNIAASVRQHFIDIEQDENTHDVTYENSQARERTQILMDYANKINGLVIGTGDLSELALGWCTYNGDHMSMYGVNSSIPKTLVRYLVAHFATEAATSSSATSGSATASDTIASNKNKKLSEVLRDILDTPVSPELLPPDASGKISQKTEDIVGPYELHDFFLYYVLRCGFEPKKIFFLAQEAFCKNPDEIEITINEGEAQGTYTKDEILKWLRNFYRRFFSQQFKRSCMPDGAKVGTVSLSPRGDWRMPSDASAAVWLKQLDELEKC